MRVFTFHFYRAEEFTVFRLQAVIGQTEACLGASTVGVKRIIGILDHWLLVGRVVEGRIGKV